MTLIINKIDFLIFLSIKFMNLHNFVVLCVPDQILVLVIVQFHEIC